MCRFREMLGVTLLILLMGISAAFQPLTAQDKAKKKKKMEIL